MVVIACIYTLLFLTDIVDDVRIRGAVGNGLMGLVTFSLVLNFSFVIGVSIKSVKCKKR